MEKMKKDRLVLLTEYQLESLVYQKVRKANQDLYRGISPILSDIQTQLREIQEELEFIKLSVKPKARKKKENG